jgi:hypothetical protein
MAIFSMLYLNVGPSVRPAIAEVNPIRVAADESELYAWIERRTQRSPRARSRACQKE